MSWNTQWRKEDADETFHLMLRRDIWDVVVPELVFEENT